MSLKRTATLFHVDSLASNIFCTSPLITNSRFIFSQAQTEKFENLDQTIANAYNFYRENTAISIKREQAVFMYRLYLLKILIEDANKHGQSTLIDQKLDSFETQEIALVRIITTLYENLQDMLFENFEALKQLLQVRCYLLEEFKELGVEVATFTNREIKQNSNFNDIISKENLDDGSWVKNRFVIETIYDNPSQKVIPAPLEKILLEYTKN